jgi:hypothetical protein
VVPFGLRGADDSDRSQVNIRYRAGNNEERGALLPITAGGFGLVAVNRLAMNVIHEVRPSWLDDDNTLRTLLFNCECELTAGGAEWLGEDFSFFKQVRDHVDCWALIRGESDHAGTIIDLGEVGALFS